MILLYIAALLAPLVIFIYAVRGTGEGKKMPRWPEWTPCRVRFAALMGVASVALALARLTFGFEADENCQNTFASVMNAAFSSGVVYFDALFILATPLMVVAVFRRQAKWAVGAGLLVTLGFGACFQVTQDFTCPGFG